MTEPYDTRSLASRLAESVSADVSRLRSKIAATRASLGAMESHLEYSEALLQQLRNAPTGIWMQGGFAAYPSVGSDSDSAQGAEEDADNEETEPAKIVPPVEGVARPGELTDALLAVLAASGSAVTIKELTTAIGREPVERRVNSVRLTMKRLLKQGLVAIDESGRYYLSGGEVTAPTPDDAASPDRDEEAIDAVAQIEALPPWSFGTRSHHRRMSVLTLMTRAPERAWSTRELSEELGENLSGRFREMLREMANDGELTRDSEDNRLRYRLGRPRVEQPVKSPAEPSTPAPASRLSGSSRDARILQILDEAGEPMTAREVTERLGEEAVPSRIETLRSALTRLAAEGRARKLPDGKYVSLSVTLRLAATNSPENTASEPLPSSTTTVVVDEVAGLLTSAGRPMEVWHLVEALHLDRSAESLASVKEVLYRLVDEHRVDQVSPGWFEIARGQEPKPPQHHEEEAGVI